MYIADWYNPVITHYQRSYRHPDRDDEHGRIWRVTATGRPLLKKPTLTGLSTAQLVKRLESPVRWERRMVRQLLRDVDTDDLVASVHAWLKADVRIGDHEIFKALSVLESKEHVDEALLRRLLSVKDHRGRAYAARVVGRWSDRLEDPLALLQTCVQDEHPRVRLEAIVAASDSPDPQAIKVILQSLDKPVDRFIQTALRCTVVGSQDRWKPALLKGELKFDNPLHLAFLLKTSGATGIGDQVRKLIDSAELDQAGKDGLRMVLAGIGNAADLRRIFDSGAKNPDVLAALDAAARTRQIKPSGSLGPPLLRLIEEGDIPLRIEALHLAASWQLGELAKPAGQIMNNPKESVEVRVAAVAAFARLDGQATTALTKLLQTTKKVAAVQVAAVEALAVSDPEIAARYAVEFLHADRDQDSVRAMVIPFLGRRKGDEKLAAALAANPPSKNVALSVRSALIAVGRHSPALDKVLMPSLSEDAVGMPTYNRDYVANLAKDAAEHGDAANGAKVYMSAALNCIACHRIGSSGGVVGPDLTGVGAGMRPDMIIESVLWPKRQVKEGYMSTTLMSDDGRIVSGYIQSEDDRKIVIRNAADGTLNTLQKKNIEERRNAGSLMPPGITASLDPTELRDLIKYLTSRNGLLK
jgi:putative heme-binding domain-containing protein